MCCENVAGHLTPDERQMIRRDRAVPWLGEGGIDWSARWMFHARNAVTTLVPLERGHGGIRVDAAVF